MLSFEKEAFEFGRKINSRGLPNESSIPAVIIKYLSIVKIKEQSVNSLFVLPSGGYLADNSLTTSVFSEEFRSVKSYANYLRIGMLISSHR